MNKNNNLLILGAGGHGRVVGEIAAATGQFSKISFLDDHSACALGALDDAAAFTEEYRFAFAGIGDNRLRSELYELLSSCGYEIPVIIHPTAFISPSAVIEKGTVIEPKAIVNTGSRIGRGCVVSVGAIIDHNVSAGDFCHINAGAICKGDSVVMPFVKLEAGQIVVAQRD